MMSGERGISAFPDGDKLFSWVATVEGPSGTVYEGFTKICTLMKKMIVNSKLCCTGLSFKLRINFPDGYPYSAPSVKFTSPCYHPNVDQVIIKLWHYLFLDSFFSSFFPAWKYLSRYSQRKMVGPV